jgi:PAS domain S-box-containing protein
MSPEVVKRLKRKVGLWPSQFSRTVQTGAGLEVALLGSTCNGRNAAAVVFAAVQRHALPMIRKHLLVGGALLLATTIFLVDLLTPLDGAVAVLYIAAILLLAPVGRRLVVGAGLITAALTTIAFLAEHHDAPSEGALTRFVVSLTAIAVTVLLSLRDRASRTTLSEQARILELSHDTVIIRDTSDRIIYWNDGAEQLYGFGRAEVLGKACDTLLQCRFPAAEVQAALDRDGHWSGEVSRTRRDGERIVLQSRWLRRHDADGRAIGVIESSADLTQQRRADAGRKASEARYRTMFEGSAFPTWEADWSRAFSYVRDRLPRYEDSDRWVTSHPEQVREALDLTEILTVNQAAVEHFEVESEADLVGANLQGLHSHESSVALGRLLVALVNGARHADCDIRCQTFRGRWIECFFRVTILPDGVRGSRVLAMGFDITERNEARTRLDQMSAELAHAARISMLGQLAASITHEVNQPLTAIINYGKSGKRWLGRSNPDLSELESCLDKIVVNGSRAADVIGRVRSLARKAAPEVAPLDIEELIQDGIAFVEREARGEQVAVRYIPSREVPLVIGDRVQIQQVLVNLMINAIHSMREIDRTKEICIHTEVLDDGLVQVAVADCGSGFPEDTVTRLFEPFFTTKKEGMGIGLSICRSIVESQGGRITASNNEAFGATVAFTLPAHASGTVPVNNAYLDMARPQ